MWSKILTVSYETQLWKKFRCYFLLSTLLLLGFVRFTDADDDVVVRLYKSLTVYDVIPIDNGPLNSTYYNSSCINLMYTHGFNGKADGNTTNTSMNGMLYYKNHICCANIFLLDWSKKASTPSGIGEYATKLLYPKVVTESIVIAKQVAKLLLFWAENYGFKIGCLYLIGHSLGAHLFCNVGREINRNGLKIYKITGLDAAGALYGNFSIFKRLDETCAIKVDCLHSDETSNPETSNRYGMNETVGIDYWLNRYTYESQVQPGCKMGNHPFMSPDSLCSHNRAPEVFAYTWRYQTCCLVCLNGTIRQNQTSSQNETESQTPTFQASGAPNYYVWAAGNSSSSVIILGACVNCNASGNYYLTTTGTYPYAKGLAGAYPP